MSPSANPVQIRQALELDYSPSEFYAFLSNEKSQDANGTLAFLFT
jgi:hypothetical protein